MISVDRVAYRFRAPVETAFGTLTEREVVWVLIDGGVGEAAPLEPYDGVSVGAVEAALLDAARELAGRADPGAAEDEAAIAGAAADEAAIARALSRLDDGPPQARAALDMALWDARGKREGRPVAELLAEGPLRGVAPPELLAERPLRGVAPPEPLAAVPVNAVVGATDRAGAALGAAEAVTRGFRCLKVKVGVGDDAGRLAAVRAALGPEVAIRIDANGAWTVDEAIASLRALAPSGIELCEEPVHGVAELRAVRKAVDVPIAMDETAREPGAVASGAADLVCLKVAACGGIGPLLEAARAARAAGSEVYLASTFDGPAGIAAALHAAAALRVTRPCGLATLSLFADVEDPFPPQDGRIAVPLAPGLGVAGEA